MAVACVHFFKTQVKGVVKVQFANGAAVVIGFCEAGAPGGVGAVPEGGVAEGVAVGRIDASHQTGSAGDADGTAAVGTGEDGALPGDAIQVGRLNKGVPGIPGVFVGVLIGAEVDDVGTFARALGGIDPSRECPS